MLFFNLKKKILKDSPPLFKNELILERNATMQQRPALETLKREALDLETQIRQLQVSFFYVFFFSFRSSFTCTCTILEQDIIVYFIFIFYL